MPLFLERLWLAYNVEGIGKRSFQPPKTPGSNLFMAESNSADESSTPISRLATMILSLLNLRDNVLAMAPAIAVISCGAVVVD